MKAVSVRQPWAWLIIHAGKDIENRTWATRHRGPLLIHASLTPDPRLDDIRQILTDEFDIHIPPTTELDFGGIVGRVNLVDCFKVSPIVSPNDSPWLEGPWAWKLADPEPLPFSACKGRLKIFDVEVDGGTNANTRHSASFQA